MSKFKFIAGVLMVNALAVMFTAEQASAQAYPSRPIRIITGAAGGGTDFMARLVGQALAPLGQPTVVDNRPSGVLQGDLAAHAAPDGYTILVCSGNLWVAGFMQTVPYDVVKDFKPITMAAVSPYILIVYPQLPVKSVKDLVAMAKAKPGELNYASLETGSSNHLAGELFKAMTGTNITRVAYKSAAIGMTDLATGQTQIMFTAVTSAAPQVKSGRVKGLAMTSLKPSPLFPELPTVAATVPGYETAATYGVFAPAKLPPAIVTRLNEAIAKYFKTAEAKERLFNASVEPLANSPEEFAAMMKADMTKWGKVIKDAGIRAE